MKYSEMTGQILLFKGDKTDVRPCVWVFPRFGPLHNIVQAIHNSSA